MSKDNRFNKKEYSYDDESFNGYSASKQSGNKQQVLEQKPKSSFKRINKRGLA